MLELPHSDLLLILDLMSSLTGMGERKSVEEFREENSCTPHAFRTEIELCIDFPTFHMEKRFEFRDFRSKY